jgi:hypothetical protein
MVGGGLVLALAGAAMLFGSASLASGQAGPSLSISPPSQNVNAGTEEINLEVKVNNVTNLGAYEFTLVFDASVLEFLGAGDYGFLASTGRTQTCFGYGQSAATINQYAVLHAGCGTNGLIDNGQGKTGPNGAGTLAQLVFKAKGLGTSNLVFKGLGTDKYYIGGPDPSLPAGAFESGQTSLTFVEVCNSGICEEQDIPFAPAAGVVAVIDPNAPTPTALPPTATAEPPSNVDEDDFQATVAAAVGTPRVLPTPAPGSTQAAAATAAAQTPGGATTGTGTGAGSNPGSGNVAASGTSPGSGRGPLPEGVTIGPDGIPRGPDGVPIAGYGPQQQEPNVIWVWAGIAMLLAGAVTIAVGAHRRKAGIGARSD